MSTTILGEVVVTQAAVAPADPAAINLAGLEYSAFTSGLMIFPDPGASDAALEMSELVSAASAGEIAGLAQADDAAGAVIVDAVIDTAAVAAPILVIADDTQAEIDIATIV